MGARIRICIEQAGYRTVEAFAFEFGIGKSTLSEVLGGKKAPTVTTLARWANALKIPLREFFEDKQLDEWVRETPPDYFHNRGKTPRPAKKNTGRTARRSPQNSPQGREDPQGLKNRPAEKAGLSKKRNPASQVPSVSAVIARDQGRVAEGASILPSSVYRRF